MTYSYDVTTSVGQVRLLIPDRVTPNQVFENEEIEAYLALKGDDIRCAAAAALETIAADQALVLKVMTLLDVHTDGARVAEALLKRAMMLREQAEADSTTFDWAEMVTTDFAARERIIAQDLRGL